MFIRQGFSPKIYTGALFCFKYHKVPSTSLDPTRLQQHFCEMNFAQLVYWVQKKLFFKV